jgi:hypothetical protein
VPIEGWDERIAEAQTCRTYVIAGTVYDRVA